MRCALIAIGVVLSSRRRCHHSSGHNSSHHHHPHLAAAAAADDNTSMPLLLQMLVQTTPHGRQSGEGNGRLSRRMVVDESCVEDTSPQKWPRSHLFALSNDFHAAIFWGVGPQLS
jgi:hypothetical protein